MVVNKAHFEQISTNFPGQWPLLCSSSGKWVWNVDGQPFDLKYPASRNMKLCFVQICSRVTSSQHKGKHISIFIQPLAAPLVSYIFIFNLEKLNHDGLFEQFTSYPLDVELSQCSEKSRNEEINESPWVDPATSQKATRTVWLAPLWHKVQQMWYCMMTNIPFLTAVLVMLRWILCGICFSYTCNVCTSKESASIYSSTGVKFLQPEKNIDAVYFTF